jgi:hypothetical protein
MANGVEVPKGYPEDRAVRVALQIKRPRGGLQLALVRNRLLEHAGVNGQARAAARRQK